MGWPSGSLVRQPKDGEPLQWMMLMLTSTCMNSFFHLFLDDLQVRRFEVPCDGPNIASMSNTAPAPEALELKKFSSCCRIL